MSVTVTPPAGPAAPDDRDAGTRREWLAPFPADVRLILSVHRRGSRDPAYRTDESGAVWRTSLTPDGPGTLRVTGRPAADGTAVTGQAWGPGAAWLLDTLPAQLGAHDDPAGFTAVHPVIGELALRHPGLRIGRTARVFEALVPAVLEQKVVGLEAAPGLAHPARPARRPRPRARAAGMRVCPPAATWARIPSWDWHRAGVEGVRARTIMTAAGVAGRLEQAGCSTTTRPSAACAPCPASGPGPTPRSGSGPRVTPTRSRSATTTCRTRWAGPWPGSAAPTTPACSSCSRPTPGTATG